MTVTSTSAAPTSSSAPSAASDVQRAVAVMRLARRQQTEQAASLVELIQQAGTPPGVGTRLNVYA